jgi:pimeloyl-ACP methyl ester carboxylesterase
VREDVHYLTTRDGARLALTEIVRGTPNLEGPRFLLIHGFAQNRLAFTLGRLPELLLDRGGRVFIGELRGHGRSKNGETPRHSVEAHVAIDLPALIERVGPPVHLMGHSMGGMLAYALLARPSGLGSVATFGAPLYLGRGRPLLQLAAILARPIGGATPNGVPVDLLLRGLSSMLAARDAKGASQALQRIARLASPAHAAPESIEAILAHADRASSAVFVEMAKTIWSRRPMLAGVSMVEALVRAPIPVATVFGTEDLFGDRSSLAPFDLPDQAGPRLVIEVPGGKHVDLTIGHHLPRTIERLWPFLLERR